MLRLEYSHTKEDSLYPVSIYRRTRAAKQAGALTALDDVSRYFELGDWKVFYILGINMEPLVFGELVMEFADQIKDARLARDKKITQI